MNKFLYIFVLLTVIFIIIFLLNKLRKKTTNELEKVLYIQNKPKLYLHLLKNPRLKILYGKTALLQFEMNAYLLMGDDFQTENIIRLLDTMVMTKGESLEYNQKKLSYFCSQGNKDKAETALEAIENHLSKAKGSKSELIRKESELIFDIYISHDTKLIQKLEQVKTKEQGAARGLTLYRLAKLYYFDHNNNKAEACLIQAKELLKNTVWRDITESAIKDISVLNYK